ncbi:hypothetical protein J3R83DRAFT_1658 [Lanmaoa asiatica]|nr:hypothetical protein J3R83DRAFT_1658 [Lanmaoa asiatica]
MSRQGGKLKPLKVCLTDLTISSHPGPTPTVGSQERQKDEDEDDKAFKEKKKAEEAALKAAKDKGTHDLTSDMTWPNHLLIVSGLFDHRSAMETHSYQRYGYISSLWSRVVE